MSTVILTEGTTRRWVLASRPLVVSWTRQRGVDAVWLSNNMHTKPTDWCCVKEVAGSNISYTPVFGKLPENVGALGVGRIVRGPEGEGTQERQKVARAKEHSQVYFHVSACFGFFVPCFNNWLAIQDFTRAAAELATMQCANEFRVTVAPLQDEKPRKLRHADPTKTCFLPVVRLENPDGTWCEGFVVTDNDLHPVGVLVPSGHDWHTMALRPLPNGPLAIPCSVEVLKSDLYASHT